MSPANIRTSSTMCWTGAEDALGAARAAPDLLRQLRLAQLRPRLVAAADACAGCSRTCRGAARSRRWPTRCFTADKVGGELAYLDRASSARVRAALWLGLAADAPPRGAAARRPALGARARAARRTPSPSGFATYLPKLTYPIRVGTHFNTAFALILALDWAEANDPALAGADPRRARRTGSAATATARPGSRAATNSCRRR